MIFALLVAGLIAVFSTLIYGIVAPMFGCDIAAKKETFITMDAGDIPRKKVRESLEAIGCRITQDQKKEIEGKMGIGVLSWGENISVEFVDGGMKVTSRCIWPMQVIDWGKNRTNVRRFTDEWEKRLKEDIP
jgi:hypothetical protein